MNKKIDTVKYLGIPYKFKGRSFTEGMDCTTILQAYFKELDYDLYIPDYTLDDRGTMKLAKVFVREVAKIVSENILIPTIKELQPHDLVCFCTLRHFISMVGVYVDEKRVLCIPHKGTSMLIKLDSEWKHKFRFGVRLI